MKILFTLILVCIVQTGAYAQAVEALMTERAIPCADIIYNSSLLIPEHVEMNNADTVVAILQYWENHCGMSEPLLRTKILLAIQADTLDETLYKYRPIIHFLISYRTRIQNKKPDNKYVPYYNNAVLNPEFHVFTKNLATELKNKRNHSPLENFFLDFYSNRFDNIFSRMQDSTLAGSKLQEAYTKEVDEIKDSPEGHFSFYSGVWVPMGNIEVVGYHPIIGIQFGIKKNKYLIDGVLEFKFGKSPNTYHVVKDDSLYSTNHFFGGYVGVELGRELFVYKSNEVDLIGGIGWDGFDALSIGDNDDPDQISKTINSLNLNIGLGYRKYFWNKSYIGIEG